MSLILTTDLVVLPAVPLEKLHLIHHILVHEIIGLKLEIKL